MSVRQPVNSLPISRSLGGIRSRALVPPRGWFTSSSGDSTTSPVAAWIAGLCRSSRNSKNTANAAALRTFVPAARPRWPAPKNRSRSRAVISHNGRPNHSRSATTAATSARIVASVIPAEARASTNSASRSCPNAATSSGVSSRNCGRMSRTAASPTRPLLFSYQGRHH